MKRFVIEFGFLFVFIHLIFAYDLSKGNWASCRGDAPASAVTVNTSQVLRQLRSVMELQGMAAYIIPSTDAHLNEFVSAYDRRLQFVSGFSGSEGIAVVTMEHAALWTDGRYFLQAEGDLSCDWILMRESEAGVPSLTEWLKNVLPVQEIVLVGACPLFISNVIWMKYEDDLRRRQIALAALEHDLVDKIWTADRPPMPSTTINPLDTRFVSKTWQDKLEDVVNAMEENDVDMLVLTDMAETAYLFNLRATDIRGFVNDPFFYSYAIIRKNVSEPRLYIKDFGRKLTEEPTDPESKTNVMTHLNTGSSGSCSGHTGHCVDVHEYDSELFIDDVKDLANLAEIKRVWISYKCNRALATAISHGKLYIDNTPVAMMKTVKGPTEREGMRNSHMRDAAALIGFMAKLEKEVKAGKTWTELSAANELARFRAKQKYNRGNSFAAISSVGPNAAINHYFVTNVTDRKITMDETYLLDSGGQYLDGTTDVTRTFVFGTPTDFIKECYTRVLMGEINLALAVWNKGKYGREIDAFARKPLWDVGLIYRHGTGHGIGAYLSVHEGPGRISNYHTLKPWDVPLEEYMMYSDEPGYYEEGKFGIRLENIIMVKKVNTKYKFPGSTMLGFETLTFVPYEPHLIDTSIMSKEQIDWLNAYNKHCLKKVGPLLKNAGDEDGYAWLESRTGELDNTSASNTLTVRVNFMVISVIFGFLCVLQI